MEPTLNTHKDLNKAKPPVLKRAFDVAVSLAALVLLSPVLLLAAIAVKLGAPGPVLFRQERMGKNFRRFKILKFRTMVVDAPKLGGQITAGSDPRITRIGSFLRKTKIDELPQLLNVLIGDMSIVGPRPEVPKYVEMFSEDFRVVLSVRPGITDPASIVYRNESSLLANSVDPEQTYVSDILPHKIKLAKKYVRHMSLLRDGMIMIKTIAAVLRN
jgi:lipopolysaccharide/colanic/teichoic acid biosynthesis glycosyltransferase